MTPMKCPCRVEQSRQNRRLTEKGEGAVQTQPAGRESGCPPRTAISPQNPLQLKRCSDNLEMCFLRETQRLARILGTNHDRLHHLLKRLDEREIPPSTLGFLPHDSKGVLRCKRLAIGAVRGQRVVDIDGLQD